jgi:hypothetical protein
MNSRLTATQLVPAFLLLAFAVIVIGGAAALLSAGGVSDRLAVLALPFGIAAACLALNALFHDRSGWLSLVLYAVNSLAITYGVILVLSFPLRLSVEGGCQPAPAPCPLGYDYPLTAGESTAVAVAVVSGGLALLMTFIAAETSYRRGRRLTAAQMQTPSQTPIPLKAANQPDIEKPVAADEARADSAPPPAEPAPPPATPGES